MAVLAEAGSLLSSSLDYAQTLRAVADVIVPRVADWCSIELLDPAGGLRSVGLAHHDPDRLAIARAYRERRAPDPDPARTTGVYQVIRTGTSELYPEITPEMLAPSRQDPDVAALLDRIVIASALVVPIAAREQTLGALALYMGESGRRFDREDVPFAEELAHRAGLAIDNARLYAGSREALAAAERATERARLLHRLSQALGAATRREDVAAVIVAEGRDAIGAASAYVWIKTADGTALEMVASAGLGGPVIDAYRRIAMDTDLPLVHSVKTGETVVLENSAALARFPAAAMAAAVTPFRAWATVPFIVGGEAIGGLSASFLEERRFDDAERALLDTMTGHASQALERCRLFEAERAARAQAQAADRKKDEFLAILGHELRNPLSPIVTALDLMRLRGLGDSRELAVIQRQTRHLIRLVDDLLDISRITRGKIVIDRQPIELLRVVSRAVETVSPLIEERRHQLVVDVAESGLAVAGDEVRLAQVVGNLLNNAAKYTRPGGRIHLGATRVGGEVRLTVRDDGAGIAAELLPEVFDLFVQGETTIDRAEGGLGLGLALVKSLVELHGGRVTAHSEGAGRGTELEVILPALATEAAPEPAPPEIAVGEGRGRVLIVDDNEDAADLMGALLETHGYEIIVAYDPVAALALAAEHHPEIAVLDIGLPVIDGYELARRLRAGATSSPYLIAVTGYGQDSDKARARAAGFDAHVVKPVSLERLLELLASRAPARE